MSAAASNDVVPARRVVLLGASNLTRGISTVVESSWHAWGRPLDVLAALGHGRSYGMRSKVLVRALPGIAECGLWEAIAQRPALPTAALLTDIGNDLLYEAPVEQIVEWVELCLDRLMGHAGQPSWLFEDQRDAYPTARVAMTLLPLASLDTLSERKFRLFRSILFPACRLPLEVLHRRAIELNERVRQIGAARGIALIEPRAAWYGHDPIHLRMRDWRPAWQEILAAWRNDDALPAARGSLARWLRLRALAPQCRWICGIEQRSAQPAARLRDGTTISFY